MAARSGRPQRGPPWVPEGGWAGAAERRPTLRTEGARPGRTVADVGGPCGVSVPWCRRHGWAGPHGAPAQRAAGAQVEHGALRAGRSARARGWGARGQQCGERVSLLAPAEPGPPRRLTLPPASFPSPAGGGGGFRCAGVSSRPDTSLFQSFPGGTHWPGKTVWQPSARRSGARLGGQSAPSRSDRRPPTPHKAPSAHPQTEFAKCSSKAINTVQGEFPHLSLNKAHSGGLVYSQTAESVNDPEPRLPVTQMAVDKDLASCSKCQGCQWG